MNSLKYYLSMLVIGSSLALFAETVAPTAEPECPEGQEFDAVEQKCVNEADDADELENGDKLE